MTPRELADQLAIDPKRLRAWLRKEFTRSPAEHGSRWDLSDSIAEAARDHFRG